MLRLYAERLARRDVLIGVHEIMLVESQTGLFSHEKPCLFDNCKSGVGVACVLTNGVRGAGQSTQPVMLYVTVVVSPYTTSYSVLPINPTNLQSTNRQTGVPSAWNALRDAKKALTTMNDLSNTWEDALERIKWVMDTVSPVAEVRHGCDASMRILG